MGYQERRDQLVIKANQAFVEPSQATHTLPLIAPPVLYRMRILVPLHDYTEMS